MVVNGHVDAGRLLGGRVAAAPISWGVCEVPGWGHVLPVDTVLAQMASLGLRGTELGPPGFLPDEPSALRASLDRHGLHLIGAFLAVPLHEEAALPRSLAEAERAVRQMVGAGGEELVLAAATGLDGYDQRPDLTGPQWQTLLEAARRIRDLAAAHGVRTTLHPHVGTHVEGPGEVRRWLTDCDLPLCLDTGHLLIGGCDPLALAREHADRVGHVHLKDVDAGLAEQVRTGRITYMQGVQQGLYVPLGAGEVPIAQIVATLEAAGYTGWYVLEQDTSLPDGSDAQVAASLGDVVASLRYLAEVTGAPVPA